MSLDEALGLTGAEATDDSIHIDVNTRQVTVPESQQLFGVESDENVEVKHIVLDGRYNDGTDLSTLTLRVNWRNANGGKGSYLVTNLDVTEDSIAFDWVISRGVVAYKGTVYFIVCAFKVNSTGKTEQEWNSSLGQGSVLEGLEVTDEDIGGDDTVNRMLTILQQMNSVQTAAKNSADAAAASSKSASDTAGSIKDSLDQIASNAAAVSQLKEATAKLKDGKISKFYASSQGNTNLPDSDDGRIMDLKLYGKSSQQQYSGKNLLKNVNWDTQTKSGVTVEKVTNTTFKISGTATDDVSFDSSWGQAISVPAQSYLLCKILHGSCTAGSKVTFFTSSYDAIASEIGGISPVRRSAITCGLVRFAIKKGGNIDCTVGLSLQMDAITDYEPYVGGIPSPNPEYPQEIKSVVKPSVKVTSQNYLDYKDIGGVVTAPVTLAKGDHYLTRFFLTANEEINNGVEYLRDETWARINTLGSLENGKIVVSDSTFGWYSKHMKITCTENITIRVATTDTCAITLNDYGYLDKYVDYQAPQTATLPYTLNAIPVTSGGNVTIDGQQYIADYVDVERGKLVRMCKEIDFEKVDPIGEQNLLTNSREIRYSTNSIGIKALPASTPSNEAGFITSIRRLAQGLGTWNIDQVGVWQCGQGENNNILVIRAPLATVLDVVAYFKSIGGCKGVFQAATPTETDLTADEIAAFKALVSHYPVTNVSTTSDQLDGYTVFNYPISLANGWNYVKQQLGDTRDYLYGIDLMTAEAYVNSEYAAALAEIEV